MPVASFSVRVVTQTCYALDVGVDALTVPVAFFYFLVLISLPLRFAHLLSLP